MAFKKGFYRFTPNVIFDNIFQPAFKFATDYKLQCDDENGVYFLEMEVPGFNKTNLNVEYDIHNSLIIVTGNNDKGKTIAKKISIDFAISDKTEAEIEDGVLKLTFDKVEDSSFRKIKIK